MPSQERAGFLVAFTARAMHVGCSPRGLGAYPRGELHDGAHGAGLPGTGGRRGGGHVLRRAAGAPGYALARVRDGCCAGHADTQTQWEAKGMEGLAGDASHTQALAYAAAVSNATGALHRLPTEAEWE
jgi:hypothetical protein